MKNILRLSQGRIKNSYTVVRIVGEGNNRRRLEDLGFTPKTILTLKNIAPLGGTFLVELFGYRLALRRVAADMIEVCEK